MLSKLPLHSDPRLLVGREGSDDAGVYKLTDEIALIQTVDFFTPMINDPTDFGRVAAANALSDVYAMGGRPLTALNVVCFPSPDQDPELLLAILKGGLEKIREAGALLVGGHSLKDQEIKYGLSVLGVAHPDKIVTNAAARPGQALVLTKPLGTGILSTALKGRMLSQEQERLMIRVMTALNDQAAEAMAEAGVRAATDVTGFGLLGHGLEMAQASGVELILEAAKVPVIEGVLDLAGAGMIPGGSLSNQSFCSGSVLLQEDLNPFLVNVLADAQTSGGLLMAVDQEDLPALVEGLESRGVLAAVIGRVGDPGPGRIKVVG